MKKVFGMGLALLFFASNVSALDFGIAGKVGLNGMGLDLTVALSKNINARIGMASVDIDSQSETIDVGDSGGEGTVDAELDFDYGSSALLFDWHVLNGGFRITAGMMKNNGAAELSGELVGNIVVDGLSVDQSDIAGELGGEIKLSDSYQPYIGIGWGRGAGGDGGFSFMMDLGVVMLDPSVDFDATVDAGGTNGLSQAELNTRLTKLESDAEDDLDVLELWPVLALGVNYAF